jgi:hypothetical protein
MDRDYMHSSVGDGVAGPFQEPEVKNTRGERKHDLGGIPDVAPFTRPVEDDDSSFDNMDSLEKKASVANATQYRKRTGSLRQAAMAKMRERIVATPHTIATTNSATSKNDILLPDSDANATPDLEYADGARLLASPSESCAKESYVFTIDEDNVTALLHPSASSSNSSLHYSAKVPTMSLTGRRSHRTESRTSHTTVPPRTDPDIEDDECDYSETEWWGWFILVATWIVFVVVMGSCFEVWSWAWDVGETPYAPPDLEDDDTLPITGYYPALMVCTAVMSWVWVVVAWVGMK